MEVMTVDRAEVGDPEVAEQGLRGNFTGGTVTQAVEQTP
jgi:hypothetical protein